MNDRNQALFLVVRGPHLPAFVTRHNRYATALFEWFTETMECRKDPDRAMPCLGCEATFTDRLPDTFLFIASSLPEEMLTVTGICRACASKTDRELIEHAMVLLGGNPRDLEPVFPDGGMPVFH
jgi:hypothetical protein